MANWIGVAITCIALVFAIYERWQRTRMETIVRNTLRGLAGSVRVVFSNANWTDLHFRTIGHLFTEDPPNLGTIRKRVVDGARDAAACARQLSLAHQQIRTIQKSLFNDSEETLPEIMADDVKAAQQSVAPSLPASASLPEQKHNQNL